MNTDAITAIPNSREAELKAELGDIVGAQNVRDDDATLALFSEDIWSVSPHTAALVVAPQSLDEVSRVVAVVIRAGFAIATRGAGMSYTGAYLPGDDRTVSLDMTRMDRVLDIRPDDMTVTVEAGCTWAALNAALAPHGLRTPFWGAMSGLKSTIGGGLSNLNAMFGAGHHGTTSESVIAVTVVLADGSILRTGARGRDGNTPFYRHHGPDLTGLFCGDSGVFGVKAEITLRLIRTPAHEDYLSFSFPTGVQLIEALAEVTRTGLASESCGFDPALTRARLKRASLATDVKALGAVMSRQKSFGKGLLAAAKVALGGRDFVPEDGWPLHLVAEGRSAAGVAQDAAEMRRIAARHQGVEIENTIARMIRAMPFPPLNAVVGPDGEGWTPVHGQCPLSMAPEIFEAIEAIFASHAREIDRLGVWTAYLFSSLSTNAITVEPVFYWPQPWRPIHENAAEEAHLARLTKPEPSAEARALVELLRADVIAVFARYGVAHFQIGRTYPYRESRDDASKALLDAIKASVDPGGKINPGVLGFPEA
jgi:D-lactate dehydrogenase (cytochrome)